jgi:hypothetical protein
VAQIVDSDACQARARGNSLPRLFEIGAWVGRFFMVAVLLNRYGDTIRASIEKHLGRWVTLGAIVLVLGFVIAYRLV